MITVSYLKTDNMHLSLPHVAFTFRRLGHGPADFQPRHLDRGGLTQNGPRHHHQDHRSRRARARSPGTGPVKLESPQGHGQRPHISFLKGNHVATRRRKSTSTSYFFRLFKLRHTMAAKKKHKERNEGRRENNSKAEHGQREKGNRAQHNDRYRTWDGQRKGVTHIEDENAGKVDEGHDRAKQLEKTQVHFRRNPRRGKQAENAMMQKSGVLQDKGESTEGKHQRVNHETNHHGESCGKPKGKVASPCNTEERRETRKQKGDSSRQKDSKGDKKANNTKERKLTERRNTRKVARTRRTPQWYYRGPSVRDARGFSRRGFARIFACIGSRVCSNKPRWRHDPFAESTGIQTVLKEAAKGTSQSGRRSSRKPEG